MNEDRKAVGEPDPLYTGMVIWRVGELDWTVGMRERAPGPETGLGRGGWEPAVSPWPTYTAVCVSYVHEPGAGVTLDGWWAGTAYVDHYSAAEADAAAHEHPGAVVAGALPGDFFQLPGESFPRHFRYPE